MRICALLRYIRMVMEAGFTLPMYEAVSKLVACDIIPTSYLSELTSAAIADCHSTRVRNHSSVWKLLVVQYKGHVPHSQQRKCVYAGVPWATAKSESVVCILAGAYNISIILWWGWLRHNLVLSMFTDQVLKVLISCAGFASVMEVFEELQAFCVRFSHHKDASSLFKKISSLVN